MLSTTLAATYVTPAGVTIRAFICSSTFGLLTIVTNLHTVKKRVAPVSSCFFFFFKLRQCIIYNAICLYLGK